VGVGGVSYVSGGHVGVKAVGLCALLVGLCFGRTPVGWLVRCIMYKINWEKTLK